MGKQETGDMKREDSGEPWYAWSLAWQSQGVSEAANKEILW